MLNIKIKLILITSIIIFSYSYALADANDKNCAFRTAIFGHALTYNLNKNNAIGVHAGSLPRDIKENNIEKQTTRFYGINHAYAFDCINCDSIIIATLLGYGETVFKTSDESTYAYSGPVLNVNIGYNWYFENDISVILGIGPSAAFGGKKSENVKSSNNYGEKVDERVNKTRFNIINPVPFFIVGYSF